MKDLSKCGAKAVAEAFGDLKPNALQYSDPIVFARDLQEWHLRQAARNALARRESLKALEQYPDVNVATPRYLFDGPGEGENR
jgi:hypothetical protein